MIAIQKWFRPKQYFKKTIMKSANRKLTVNRKFQSREYKRFISVPEIRLCGKWLKEAGFNEAGQVKVAVKEGKLIITKIK
ncbi:MAG: toxic protein SymE [Crocinitomicaceae bacterium]